MKHQHNLNIAGVELPLTSEHDERYVQALAAELSRRIIRLSSGHTSVGKMEAALVCALDLLDENCRMKLELEDMKKGTAK